MGQKQTGIRVRHTVDYHQMHNDLSKIVRNQIDKISAKIQADIDLDAKELKRLDTCFDGLKRLLDIGKLLKGDKISSMTDDELKKAARKVLREGRKHG